MMLKFIYIYEMKYFEVQVASGDPQAKGLTHLRAVPFQVRKPGLSALLSWMAQRIMPRRQGAGVDLRFSIAQELAANII